MTPKYVTMNDLEWLFYVKFCFRACTHLQFFCVDFENNCVEMNKDKLTLSPARMYVRDFSFWKYKVYPDIYGSFLATRRQTTLQWVVQNGVFSVLSMSVSSEASETRPTFMIIQCYLVPHWLSTDHKTII